MSILKAPHTQTRRTQVRRLAVALPLTAALLATGTSSASAAVPVIGGLFPATGDYRGGETVKITGANFTGVTAVKFGLKTATVVSKTDSQIIVTTPSGTNATTVSVRAASPEGTSPTFSGTDFAYDTLWFAPNYAPAGAVDTNDFVGAVPAWTTEEEKGGTPAAPTGPNVRLAVGASVPGTTTDPLRPPGSLVATVNPGDSTSGYRRSEVSTQVQQWGTKPVDTTYQGDEAWVDFPIYVPTSTPLSGPQTSGPDQSWTVIYQWKTKANVMAPAVTIGMKAASGSTPAKFGINTANGGFVAIGDVTPGQWQRITFGVKFSFDASVGWAKGSVNGGTLIAAGPTSGPNAGHVLTLRTVDGDGNPIDQSNASYNSVYPKEGLYESTGWDAFAARTFAHGAVRIASTQALAAAR